MNGQTMRKRLSKEGPFVVRTSDGQEFVVPHPELIMVGRYNLIIEENDGGVEIIDPMHVVSIRHGPSPKRRNGQ